MPSESIRSMHARYKHLRDSGYLPAAITVLEKILVDLPEPSLWQILGNHRRDLGDLEGARQAYLRVLEIDPSWARAHACLGLLADTAGDTDAAEAHLRRSLELDESQITLVFLGSLLRNTDRCKEATQLLELAVDLDDTNEEAWFNLARAVEGGDPQRAVKLLRKAKDLGYEPAEAHIDRLSGAPDS